MYLNVNLSKVNLLQFLAKPREMGLPWKKLGEYGDEKKLMEAFFYNFLQNELKRISSQKRT
ncbi:hypothetical protein GVv1_46000 [Enterobacter pseudoroggenkampii]